jgi:hypothetical protein
MVRHMELKNTLEELVARELKDLCMSCVHAPDCAYRQAATKAVIQCEMFEYGQKDAQLIPQAQGLCSTCDHSGYCKLPGRIDGVWRCDEFS